MPFLSSKTLEASLAQMNSQTSPLKFHDIHTDDEVEEHVDLARQLVLEQVERQDLEKQLIGAKLMYVKRERLRYGR